MQHSRLALASALVLATCPAHACSPHDLEEPGQVLVIEPSFTALKTDGPTLLTVLGTFRNTSPSRVENLVVEAKLTDAQGKVVDVLSQPVYGIVVPAGREVAFRVQGQAAASSATYAGVQVRVTSGETDPPLPPRASAPEASAWVGVLVSWGPMILLILVWVLLARKYSGRGSTQDKMLAAVNEQNALLARQLSAIESIASAARQPRGND